MESANTQPAGNKMGWMPEGKLLFRMSLPLSISMLTQALYNIVDSIFVSRISENALTAVSLAYPIQMLLIAVSVGTGTGLNSLMSRRLGERRVKDAEGAADNGLFLLFLSALFFTLVGVFCAKPLFRLFTDDAEIRALGGTYLSICLTWCVGVFLQIGTERIMQSQGRNLFAMITQLVGAVFNIVFDPILIFGYFGFPALGIAGAAYATVGGQILGMLFGFAALYFGKFEIKPSLRGFRPSGAVIREIYRVGIPATIQQAIGTVMNLMMNALLISYSTTAVAIFGAYFKVQSIVFMPVFGLQNAAMSIIAFNYGAKKRARLMRTRRLALIASVVFMTLGIFVFHLFPETILSLFDASSDMLAMGVPAFRTMCIGWVFAAFSITNSTVFSATGRGFYSMIVSLVRELIVLVPAAYLLSAAFHTLGAVWWAVPIGSVFSYLSSAVLMRRVYRTQIQPLDEP